MSLSSLAARTLAALDLTCLDEDAPPARIEALCRAASGPRGAVAAVCLYPEYLRSARGWLDATGAGMVRVATVANFPSGRSDVVDAVREVRRAVAAGADEVDVVFPWQALCAGDIVIGERLVAACREACGSTVQLKVILESGELGSDQRIRAAAASAIRNGADFIKTSTGKARVGATPAAAAVMLATIAELDDRCGFKAAGGIRRLQDAAGYFDLADRILGPQWASPARFRIGASGLLDEVARVLQDPRSGADASGY